MLKRLLMEALLTYEHDSFHRLQVGDLLSTNVQSVEKYDYPKNYVPALRLILRPAKYFRVERSL